MKFNCQICQYETDTKYCYDKHLISMKHQEKASKNNLNKDFKQTSENPDEPVVYTCYYCDITFTRASSLTRHTTICPERENMITNYSKQLQEKDNIIQNKDKELKNKDKNYKNKLKDKNKLISSLESEIANLKLMVNNTGSLAKTSMSTLSYIIKNYTNAPAIEPIKNMSLLHIDYTNDKFVEQLIYEKKHKTLVNFIGDLIVEIYKKDDSEQQSIWASDISRLTYILRDMMGGKLDWIVDKKGIKTTKYIIQPILNYINKCALKYINDTDPRHTGLTTEQAVAKAIQLNKAMEISNMVDDKMLIDDLLKYIAPHFCVNKEQQMIEN